mmetsp:Transcript_8310/g.27953  ORF Transcript_8310/g.27953 Transcript_8310/m.27953 type:complete len:200 (-) Transcript_8310:421-1020(-)
MARLGVRGIGTAGAAHGRAGCHPGDAAGERKPAVFGPVVPAALTSSDDAGVDWAAPLLHLSTSHKHLLFNGSRGPARVLVMWMCWEMRGVCSSVQRRAEDAREGLADAIWNHLSSRVHHDTHLWVPARSVSAQLLDDLRECKLPSVAGSRYRPVVGVAVFHSRGVFFCSAVSVFFLLCRGWQHVRLREFWVSHGSSQRH